MNKLFIVVLGLGVLCGVSFAQPQPPDTLWTKTFGGSDWDVGNCVQQTLDGGYIIAGYTYSFGIGGSDVYFIKTDTNGDTSWTHTFGESLEDERGYSVQQTSDGGYIITGNTSSFSAAWYDVYLIKTDLNGNETWSKAFGGYNDDEGKCVQQTNDGGYIIAGYTESFGAGSADVYLIKADSNGNELWSQTYGGNYLDWGRCVRQTSDSGYIIVGNTNLGNPSGQDVFLIKTDANGNEIWSYTFGESDYDVGNSVQQTSDGGYVITGTGYSEDCDVCLIKTDANGIELWTQTYGGIAYDEGCSVQQTSDSGYIIAGCTYSFGTGYIDVYLIKTDANGNEQWSQTFGGSFFEDRGKSVQQTSDGGYIIAGRTWSYGAGSSDVYLIRLDSEGSLVEGFGKNQPAAFALNPPCPNPFNSSTVISFELRAASYVELKVYDVLGNEVKSLVNGHSSFGYHEIVWDVEGLGSGVFFIRLMVDGRWSMVRKVAVIK